MNIKMLETPPTFISLSSTKDHRIVVFLRGFYFSFACLGLVLFVYYDVDKKFLLSLNNDYSLSENETHKIRFSLTILIH